MKSPNLAIWLTLMVKLAAGDQSLSLKYISGECKIGEFYKSDEFHNRDVLEAIFEQNSERFIAKQVYCPAVELVGQVLPEGDVAICDCDCRFAHGGPGRLYCKKPEAPASCHCQYDEWDEDFIYKCTHSDWKGLNSTIMREEKCDEGEADGSEVITSGCESIFEGVITLICEGFDEAPPKHVSQVGNALIFPEDLCAIDCYTLHGAETPPYGFCANVCGRSVCYCIY